MRLISIQYYDEISITYTQEQYSFDVSVLVRPIRPTTLGGQRGRVAPGGTYGGAHFWKNVQIYIKKVQIYVERVPFYVNTDKRAEN